MLQPLQTVTMPVLIGAGDDWRGYGGPKTDGWYYPNTEDSRAVRVVGAADITARLSKIFKPKDETAFKGLGNLKWSHEQKDSYLLNLAMERISPWAPGPWSLDKNWTGVRYLYSSLINSRLQNARPVMWLSDAKGRYLPGIFCPDWKTAAFVTLAMSNVRICPNPKCGNPFVPDTDNQEYCCPKHGVAYRTQRSRWKAKHEPKKARKSLH